MNILKQLKLKDYVTLLNLTFGVLSIIFALNKLLIFAASALILSVFFDCIDGYVARKTKTANRFGLELDSLSDMVSFGVAPIVIGYVYFTINPNNFGVLYILSLIFFVACGAIRLAKFNAENKKDFEGLPITHSGLVIPILYFLFVPWYVFMGYFFIAGILMVSTFKIKKLRSGEKK